jgi:Fe-S-cluster containining protein
MKKPDIISPTYITIECSRCGVCCSEPIVPVTNKDVLRISKALGVKAAILVRFYSYKEMEYDPEADLWVRFPQGKRAMGLRKRKDRCMFLNDEKSCTVYLHRPMTCRTFPYAVDLDDSGNPETVKLNKIVSCSCKTKKKSALEHIISDVRVELSQDDDYYDMIEIWNGRKSPGGVKEFLKFVGLSDW